MAASYDSHCILYDLERLTGVIGEIRTPDWGSVGEFRPHERFVIHYDRFFLPAPICAGQCLEDFKALRGLLLQHPSVDVEGIKCGSNVIRNSLGCRSSDSGVLDRMRGG